MHLPGDDAQEWRDIIVASYLSFKALDLQVSLCALLVDIAVLSFVILRLAQRATSSGLLPDEIAMISRAP